MEGGGGGTGKVRRRRPPWSALPRPMLPQGRGAPGFTLAHNAPPPPGRHTAVAPRAAARASAPGGGGAHPSPPRWWWWSRRKERREGWRGTKENGGGGRPCRRCVAGDGRAPPPPQRVRRARRGPGRPAVLPRPAAPASGTAPGHPTGPAGRRAVEPGAAQPALPGRPPHPLARPPPPAWAAVRRQPRPAHPPPLRGSICPPRRCGRLRERGGHAAGRRDAGDTPGRHPRATARGETRMPPSRAPQQHPATASWRRARPRVPARLPRCHQRRYPGPALAAGRCRARAPCGGRAATHRARPASRARTIHRGGCRGAYQSGRRSHARRQQEQSRSRRATGAGGSSKRRERCARP